MGGFLLYVGAIGFLGGVALRTVLEITLVEVVWVLGVAFVLALWWRRVRERVEVSANSNAATFVLTLSVLLFMGGLGMLRMEYASYSETPEVFEKQVGSEVLLEGVIAREPDRRATSQHLSVLVDDEIVLATVERYETYHYGDRVTVSGTLTKPESFAGELGRTFNYPGYLEAQGVEYLVRYGEVVVIASGEGNMVVAGLLSLKQSFIQTIENLIPEPQVGLAEGLLLGVKRALGEELTTVFRKTGIIHIVVLSGYNVALVVTFVMYVLSFVLPYRVRIVVGIAAIAGFALLVGLSATVLRASLMAALLLLAQATGRIYLIARALMVTAVVMVVVNPYILVYDPGFQLSFLATLGLILGADWLQSRLGAVPGVIGIREFLTATVVTQIFVLPLLLYQIGEFSVVSVVVNVLVLPMVPIAMLLTFITGVVGAVSTTIAIPLAWLTTLSLSYILWVANWFASLPFASFLVPSFPFWVVPLAYGVMVLVGYLVYRRGVTSSSPVAGWRISKEGR